MIHSYRTIDQDETKQVDASPLVDKKPAIPTATAFSIDDLLADELPEFESEEIEIPLVPEQEVQMDVVDVSDQPDAGKHAFANNHHWR
jgi:hypothetical protein